MRKTARASRMSRKWLVLLFGIAIVPFFSADAVKAASKPSAAELAAITQRGRLLAEYDAAAGRATDAVLATHPQEGTSNRYIARETEVGWVVDFGRLNATGDKFLIVREAVQSGSFGQFRVKNFDPAREDTGWNLAAARGIETAMRDFHGTDRPYNVAVLPVRDGGMYVYLYPAQVKDGVYPLGADVRYRISRDGTKIVEKRQMHKGIIEYASRSAVGEKEAGGYHTHVLSEVPEDTDVFLVLTRRPRVPEFVGAGPYMYTIAVDGTITVADRPR